MLPALRADFALAGTYRYVEEPPLPCRITTIRGADDSHTSVRDDELWAAEAERGCATHCLPGGHFFVHEQRARVLQLVADAFGSPEP